MPQAQNTAGVETPARSQAHDAPHLERVGDLWSLSLPFCVRGRLDLGRATARIVHDYGHRFLAQDAGLHE